MIPQYCRAKIPFFAKSVFYKAKNFIFRNIKPMKIGKNSYIDPTVHLMRWRSVVVGSNSCIGEWSTININNYGDEGPSLVIGDSCWIGRRNFISPGKLVSFSNYCMTGPDCKFIGADHDFSSPFSPYIKNKSILNGSIIIGANCWIGANVIVMGDVSIGYGSVVGAGSLVIDSFPPFSLIVGSPAKMVKKFDLNSNSWVRVGDCSAAFCDPVENELEYIDIIRAGSPVVDMPWRASGKSMGNFY